MSGPADMTAFVVKQITILSMNVIVKADMLLRAI
jgi:hypothetical protein